MLGYNKILIHVHAQTTSEEVSTPNKILEELLLSNPIMRKRTSIHHCIDYEIIFMVNNK